jgi:hypothetical protein
MNTGNAPIVALPRRIFSHYNMAAHERNLMNRVAIYTQERAYLPEPLIGKLACQPHLLARAILGGVVAFETERRILSDPNVAFFTVMQNYDLLAPRLEELYVQTSPDALYLLVTNMRAYPKKFLHDEKFYLDLIAKDAPTLRTWLEPEANWSSLVQEFVRMPAYASIPTAEWAYFALSRDTASKLDSKLLTLLSTKEEYLYWSARTFAGRRAKGVAAPDPNEVLRRIKTPRWAFHALRDNLASDSEVQDQLLHITKGSAAWLVELAALKIWDDAGQIHGGKMSLAGEALEQTFVEGVKRLYQDPGIDDFQCWMKATLFPPAVVALVHEFEKIPLRTKAA